MAVKFRDYYEVLGVPRDGSADDIKRAYRKLARQHHPDLKAAGERAAAAERFKEINEAYEVLKDPEKRRKYDALGSQWRQGMDFTPPPGAGGAGGGSVDLGDLGDLGGFSDFFASIFGGHATGRPGSAGTRGRRMRVTRPGSDVEAELPVSLEMLLHGGKLRMQVGGRNLDVEVPGGTRAGTVLRLAGQGEPGMGGGEPGDLYLHVRLQEHARYRVAGDDLEAELVLWPWQAVLGARVRVETPEGAVMLTVPEGSVRGARLRLRGRGLSRHDGTRGDLYAIVAIAVPRQPSAAERAAYETLQRESPAPQDRPAENEARDGDDDAR